MTTKPAIQNIIFIRNFNRYIIPHKTKIHASGEPRHQKIAKGNNSLSCNFLQWQ